MNNAKADSRTNNTRNTGVNDFNNTYVNANRNVYVQANGSCCNNGWDNDTRSPKTTTNAMKEGLS